MILLCAWSLFGTKRAIQSMTLAVTIKFLNPAIYHFEPSFALFAWGVLAVAGCRIIVDNLGRNGARNPITPWLVLYTVTILVQSLLVSHQPTVSVFKLVSFAFMAFTVMTGFKLCARGSLDWTPWFVGLWTAVALLSMLTLLAPAVGYRVNGTGFQGILNHPQAFGVFMAPMVAWLTAQLWFSKGSNVYWIYVAVPAAWALLLLSASRTALLAVVAAFAILVVVALVTRSKWRGSIGQALFRPATAVAAFVALFLMTFHTDLLSDTAYRFLRKSNNTATLEESFESSRGRGIAGQWRTFQTHPMFGIGFGVSLDPSFKPILEPLTGLPISAPVEKGFLPTAVLEETGVLGAMIFVPLLLGLSILAVAKADDIALSSLFLTSIFVNAGEMIFFSAGGFGLYTWLMIGWATSSYWKRK